MLNLLTNTTIFRSNRQMNTPKPPSVGTKPDSSDAAKVSETQAQVESWFESGQGADSLTKDDEQGISDYTGTAYAHMNVNLRGYHGIDKPLQGAIKELVQKAVAGITKLTPMPGVYYRGGSSRPEVNDAYKLGSVVMDAGFMSCEKGRVHPKYMRTPTTAMFIVNGAGRDVSPWNKALEDEVVFPPFTKFQVVERHQDGLRPVITLQEVLKNETQPS